MTEIIIEDHTLQALKDKVIIITGKPPIWKGFRGSSGIGLATVSLALAMGAKVVMGDLNPPPPKIESPDMTFVPLDVTSWQALSGLFEKAFELHGRIDHVFANAGIAPRINVLEDKTDSNGKLQEPDHRVLDINLKSVMNTAILALHYLKKQESGGSIVLTASASSFQQFQAVDYAVAKHGVLGLLRSLVPALHPLSLPIRINALAPSWTDTGIVPGAVIRQLGAPVMAPPAVARAALALMADGARDAQLVYSQALPDGGVAHREIDTGLRRAAAALCDGDAAGGPSLEEVLVGMRGVSEKAVTDTTT